MRLRSFLFGTNLGTGVILMVGLGLGEILTVFMGNEGYSLLSQITISLLSMYDRMPIVSFRNVSRFSSSLS